MTHSQVSPQFVHLEQGVPPVRGHYSHVVILPTGQFMIAGQKAWSKETGELTGHHIIEQTELVFDNIASILAQIDCSLDQLIRISCHLARVEDYEQFNEVYARRLGEHRPARTVLAGHDLREGALVELVADGFIDGKATSGRR